ncbi:PH domain-containing protein [Halorubrum salsamenti]|uniref:PH domain-containing protein n=1 Tax=Halorubrum salsamenti TaxID=2583990 RepID=UPI0011A0F4BA|nr:PH domain-containing protein [Halorubrum salsamenti]
MAAATTESDAPASTPSDRAVPEWLSLDDDEEIQWIGEPAPVSIVGTAVWGVVLTVVLIGFLILLMLPFSWLSLKNTDYVVTDKSLYVKKGVLGTNIESVALDKIQNTEYSQSFWGKQFGFGSIDISTAGSSGAEVSFRNVDNARSVRETITGLTNEYAAENRRLSPPGDETMEPAVDTATAERMDELVEELRGTRRAMERIEQHVSEEGPPANDSAPAEERSN